jgi:hypothetical protein
MEEDLIAALLAAAGVKALVGQRVNWLTRPQGSGLPAIVLQKVSGPPIYTMAGRSDLAGHLVQVSCYGATYLAAKSVARAVTAVTDALNTAHADPLPGAEIENERDTFEPGDGPQGSAASVDFFRTDLDVRVWHRTTP